MLDRIESASRQPGVTYRLDLAAGDAIFSRIDTWFEQDAGSGRAADPSNGWSVVTGLKINHPILASGEVAEPVPVVRPFDVFYLQADRKRSFVKTLRVPALRALPDDEVAALARRFLEVNGFFRPTPDDRLTLSLVISRMRERMSSEDGPAERQTLYRRVEFGREFRGLEVVNSKQVVDIHPDSLEVLGYRSIRWTPVVLDSAKSEKTISSQELVAKIEARFLATKAKVSGVRSALYETESLLVPVLVVDVDKPFGSSLSGAEGSRLHLPLVRSVSSLEDGADPRAPTAEPRIPEPDSKHLESSQ